METATRVWGDEDWTYLIDVCRTSSTRDVPQPSYPCGCRDACAVVGRRVLGLKIWRSKASNLDRSPHVLPLFT
jgi:hypothetical protein